MIVSGFGALSYSLLFDRDHEPLRWKNDKVNIEERGNFSTYLKTIPAVDSTPPNWEKPHVSVYSVRSQKHLHNHLTLSDLSESGQAHAIDFLMKYPKTESWSDIQRAFMGNDNEINLPDPFQFNRVLISTITKGATWEPGDRMVWTRVFVQPINFTFKDYFVAATENETIKIANVEDSQVRNLSVHLGSASSTGTSPKIEGQVPDIAANSERSIKTIEDINTQYEKLGIDIMPEFLRIVREGERGSDVVGNTTLSISIVTDPATIRKLTPHDVPQAQKENLVLLVTNTHLESGASELDASNGASIVVSPLDALPHCPLRARVWMLYEWRQIVKGRKYYDEFRHDIKLIRDVDMTREVEIVNADDVSPTVWSIEVIPSNGNKHKLRARVPPNGVWRELVFRESGQAAALAHWIRTARVAKLQHLEFDYEKEASLFPCKKTSNDCDTRGEPDATQCSYQQMNAASSR